MIKKKKIKLHTLSKINNTNIYKLLNIYNKTIFIQKHAAITCTQDKLD